MNNKGLLFIPDISGFTQFVNATEIDHSSHIIQELLEILINANDIGLEISEIEGDAILFYKFGEVPDLQQLYKQVEKMFCEFHRNLNAYEIGRFCQCDACKLAVNLSLKVITHYGEFAGYNVKNFSKLIGKDIIVAHQLLKNDIAQHEYWLVTKGLLQDKSPDSFTHWMNWDSSAKQTENGEIPFHYTQLSRLKDEIPPPPPLQLGLDKKVKMISVSREYDSEINKLFYTTGGFQFRSRWLEGVKGADEVSHYLPRVGTRHRSLQESGEVIIYSSSVSYTPEKIVYSETDEKKESSTFFTFEKITSDRTKLTLDFYIRKNSLTQLMFNLTKKKKLENSFARSLNKLDEVRNEIKMPGEV